MLHGKMKASLVKELDPKLLSALRRLNGLRRHTLRLVKNAKPNWHKRQLAARLGEMHRRKLTELSGKEPIRVAYVVTDLSLWKLAALFDKMQRASEFSPVVLIVRPVYPDGKGTHLRQMEMTRFFEAAGHPHIVYNGSEPEQSKAFLAEMDADIFFLSTAHSGENDGLYREIIASYLTCFVPYHFELTYENDSQTNMFFHNSMWQIFVPHDTSRQVFATRQAIKARNVSITGYPAVESLISPSAGAPTVWRRQPGRKKRVIWAPHHTVNSPQQPLSNFLTYHDLFIELSREHQEDIQFSFKPHPALRDTLNAHPQWGRTKVNAYYSFWEASPNCQLDVGSYADLFKQSDAMIHDCSSFLGEYLFVDKPVMFLCRSQDVKRHLNTAGRAALDACQIGHNAADIRAFLTLLLKGEDKNREDRKRFLASSIELQPGGRPSDRILNYLRQTLP